MKNESSWNLPAKRVHTCMSLLLGYCTSMVDTSALAQEDLISHPGHGTRLHHVFACLINVHGTWHLRLLHDIRPACPLNCLFLG